MSRLLTELSAFLATLPVDTAAERELLWAAGASGATTILVAGSPEAGVLTMIPGVSGLFTVEETLACPVRVEYGAEFSVRVTDRTGEAERYRTAADFRHFCAHRFGQLTDCRITVPAEMLRRGTLVFVTLDGSGRPLTVDRSVSGCVLVVRSDAGCLSDGETALCGQIRDVWCVADKTAMILRRQGPYVNELLPFMAGLLLGREHLGAFPCDMGGEAQAMEAAVADLLGRESGDVSERILDNCLSRVREKLRAAVEEATALEMERIHLAQGFRQTADTFRAMCLTEKYSLGDLLTREDMEHVRKEIHDFFTVLRSRFPQMTEEVVDALPTAKADLQNLAGDYLGDVTDAFLDELLCQITGEMLIPRARERFYGICRRLRRLLQEQGLEAAVPEARTEADFLRISEVNMGDFHTGISRFVAAAAGTAVWVTIQMFLIDNEILGLDDLVDQAEAWTQQTVMELTDRFMPARMYARSLGKNSAQYLTESEQRVYRSLEDTVFPRLIHTLQREFEWMTGAYVARLEQEVAAAETALGAARETRLSFEAGLAALEERMTEGGCGQ